MNVIKKSQEVLLFTNILLFTFVYSANIFADQESKATTQNIWSPYIDNNFKYSTERQLGRIDLFIPLNQDGENLIFADIRGVIDDSANREGNVGIGYRKLMALNNGAEFILGGYGFYDHKIMESGNSFNQATIGLEMMSKYLDLRANYYLADEEEKANDDANNIFLVETDKEGYSNILIERGVEKSMSGYDLEIGTAIPFAEMLRIYGGYYSFFADDVEDIKGHRARADLSLYRDIIGLEYEFSDDDARDKKHFVGLRLRYKLNGYDKDFANKEYMSYMAKRMEDKIVRDIDIVSSSYNKAATNLQNESNQDLSVFEVRGDVTANYIEENTKEGDIIFAYNQAKILGRLSLKENQSLLGEHYGLKIGDIYVISQNKDNPKALFYSPTDSVITANKNNKIAGISIDGNGSAVYGISSFTPQTLVIEENDINGVASAIFISMGNNASGSINNDISISNNNINSLYNGIFIQNSSSSNNLNTNNIANNNIYLASQNGDYDTTGIEIFARSDSIMQINNISNNQINNAINGVKILSEQNSKISISNIDYNTINSVSGEKNLASVNILSNDNSEISIGSISNNEIIADKMSNDNNYEDNAIYVKASDSSLINIAESDSDNGIYGNKIANFNSSAINVISDNDSQVKIGKDVYSNNGINNNIINAVGNAIKVESNSSKDMLVANINYNEITNISKNGILISAKANETSFYEQAGTIAPLIDLKSIHKNNITNSTNNDNTIKVNGISVVAETGQSNIYIDQGITSNNINNLSGDAIKLTANQSGYLRANKINDNILKDNASGIKITGTLDEQNIMSNSENDMATISLNSLSNNNIHITKSYPLIEGITFDSTHAGNDIVLNIDNFNNNVTHVDLPADSESEVKEYSSNYNDEDLNINQRNGNSFDE